MSDKVLVTGGAGFIGSHMVDKLIDLGNEVIVLDDLSTGFEKNISEDAIFLKGSVANPSDVKKAFENKLDAVYHIAGQASTIRSFSDPIEDLNVNVIGTINILKECLKSKVPRLLYASSMTVYGNPAVLPVREDTNCNPISYYGITKYAAERYVHSTAQRNDLDFDFNVTSFRMFNVYGTRQSLSNPYQGVVTIFISNIFNKEPITIFGDGKQSRDFVYINDVVDAWIKSMDNEETYGEVFNLGSGTRIDINKLVDVILESFNHDRSNYEVRYDKARPGDQRHMQADISISRKVLGWVPKTSFNEGMRKTIEWSKER